jgi:Uma2 family endonuclease
MQVLEVPTQMNFSPLLRRYTLEEFWALPEREDRVRYDLIGGYLFMVPPPKPPHDDIGARMIRTLMKFILENNIDVYRPLSAIWKRARGSTYLEPDMMYVSKELRAEMGDQRRSADIVFEYLSPSTSLYDRMTKADTYLALGVRELWLIDPATITIEVRYAHHETKTPAWETHIYSSGQHANSRVLNGWEVSVTEFFEGII